MTVLYSLGSRTGSVVITLVGLGHEGRDYLGSVSVRGRWIEDGYARWTTFTTCIHVNLIAWFTLLSLFVGG